MRKTLSALLAIVFLIGGVFLCGCNQKTLYAYTESGFPPFEYIQDSKIHGVDIEIAKTVASEMNMRLVVKDIEFSSIAKGIKQDNAIGLGMSISEERAKKVDFSIPYVKDVFQYVIFEEGALETDQDDMVPIEELRGKKLGVQKGSSADTLITKEKDGLFQDAKVRRYENILTATQDIGHSNDYIVIDSLSALQITDNKVGLEAKRIKNCNRSHRIAVKGNTKLLTNINNIVSRLIEEGRFKMD